MITITNTAPTIHPHARFDRPRLAALRHASSSALARYRDVNLVTNVWLRRSGFSRAFFYLAIPFRDHSLPEDFRFTEIRQCRPANQGNILLELENRYTGNRTVGSNPTFLAGLFLPIATPER